MPDNGPDNASEARQRHCPRPYIINRAGRTSVNGTTERVRRLSNSHPLTTLVPCRTKSWQNQDSVVCIVRRLPGSHSQTSTVLVPIRNNNNHDNPQSSIDAHWSAGSPCRRHAIVKVKPIPRHGAQPPTLGAVACTYGSAQPPR